MFLGLAITASVFGQSGDKPSCPVVSMVGPAGIPKPGEPVTFTASIANAVQGSDLTYTWTARNGEIIDGQGTLQVKVSWPDWCDNLLVNIEVHGLPETCPYKASEVAAVSHCKPFGPSKIAEIWEKAVETSDPRILKVRRALIENPNARLFVIVRHFRIPSRKAKERKENQINALLALPSAEKPRLEFVHTPGEIDSIQFWLVPAGTSPPSP